MASGGGLEELLEFATLNTYCFYNSKNKKNKKENKYSLLKRNKQLKENIKYSLLLMLQVQLSFIIFLRNENSSYYKTLLSLLYNLEKINGVYAWANHVSPNILDNELLRNIFLEAADINLNPSEKIKSQKIFLNCLEGLQNQIDLENRTSMSYPSKFYQGGTYPSNIFSKTYPEKSALFIVTDGDISVNEITRTVKQANRSYPFIVGLFKQHKDY